MYTIEVVERLHDGNGVGDNVDKALFGRPLLSWTGLSSSGGTMKAKAASARWPKCLIGHDVKPDMGLSRAIDYVTHRLETCADDERDDLRLLLSILEDRIPGGDDA